jgi:dienelactone hydrolase
MLAALTILVSATIAAADAPRVLPPGELPADARLGPLRHLRVDYFPMQMVDSPEAWVARREQLRRQVQVAIGHWPPPTRTPLNAVVHSPVERDDYTVWRVYFESMPGHFVTGSLYRPKKRTGPLPAVLTPYGHWSDGRFNRFSQRELHNEISIGAERFLDGGQAPLQARCVQLARMGCVVFQYDMVGYADSVQLDHLLDPRDERPEGLFGTQAELQLQSLMGLQTWNSIRAFDFLSSLPDVDPERIAVNGASSGGTQTLMLVAVDDRPAASIPFVMVSTAMQGGCRCETACYLRIGAGNVDIAALAAPRPLAINAANDWTVEVETKGYPDLRNLYKMLGHEDRLRASFHIEFRHNYNSVNRMFMYDAVNEFLDLGFDSPILERDFEPLTRDELTVWTTDHPAPSGDQVGDAHERALMNWWSNDLAEQKKALRDDPEEYRRVISGGWNAIIGRRLADVGEVNIIPKNSTTLDGFQADLVVFEHPAAGEQLPAILIGPGDDWNHRVVVWLTDTGKAGVFIDDGKLNPTVRKLLEKGYAVAAVDLIGQGEFLADGGKLTHARLNSAGGRNLPPPAEQPVEYTFGYNRPLFCQRVHDVLTVVQAIQNDPRGVERIAVVGSGRETGPIAVAAHAQADGAIARTAFVANAFRFRDVTRFDDPMFVPGATRYDGILGLEALCKEGTLMVIDAPDAPVVKWLME